MAGDGAINIQHIILGIDPPNLKRERDEASEEILD